MTILEKIFKKYYREKGIKSDVTSSHWATFGEEGIRFENNRVLIKGQGGFGDFIPLSVFGRLRNCVHLYLTGSYLKKFSQNKEIQKIAKEIARKSKRLFLLDCAKHVIALERIKEGLKDKKVKTVCLIGDGYGYFGNLLKAYDPEFTIIYVNLGKQLVFDMQLTEDIHPKYNRRLIEESRDCEFLKDDDFCFLEAENYELLKGMEIDLFINIASMQEMDKSVVDKYFELMKSSSSQKTYFYCCNRSNKTLPDGQKIIFDEYHWGDCEVIGEERPEWYKNYTCQKPPFWRPYDGPFQARFVQF